MQIDDLEDRAYAPGLHEGVTVRSIGWLGSVAPTKGVVSQEALDILAHIVDCHYVSDGDLGSHVCEICNKSDGFHGEVWLEQKDYVYVLPRGIVHYIREHNYKPPEEFLLALADFWRSGDSEQCREGGCEKLNSNRSGRDRLKELIAKRPSPPASKGQAEKANHWWKIW